jgi:hypothetical protein
MKLNTASTYIVIQLLLPATVHNISTVYSYMLQPDHCYIEESCVCLCGRLQVSVLVGALVALKPLYTSAPTQRRTCSIHAHSGMVVQRVSFMLLSSSFSERQAKLSVVAAVGGSRGITSTNSSSLGNIVAL